MRLSKAEIIYRIWGILICSVIFFYSCKFSGERLTKAAHEYQDEMAAQKYADEYMERFNERIERQLDAEELEYLRKAVKL